MPHKDPETARAYFRERAREQKKKNPERFRKASQRYHEKHRAKILAAYDPKRARAMRLKREYGLTPEAWENLFVGQGCCCAICRRTDPGSKKGWSTDHDHQTGRVRGILCMFCNTMVGLLGDSLEKVEQRTARILEYLR